MMLSKVLLNDASNAMLAEKMLWSKFPSVLLKINPRDPRPKLLRKSSGEVRIVVNRKIQKNHLRILKCNDTPGKVVCTVVGPNVALHALLVYKM